MQTTINLNEALLNEACQLTNITNQEELINLALQELVRSRSSASGQSRQPKNLLDLTGQIQFIPSFDHKVLRETRHVAD